MEWKSLPSWEVTYPIQRQLGKMNFLFPRAGICYIVPWRGPIHMRHPVWGEAGWFDSLGSSSLVLKVGPACRCLPLRLRTACQVFACRQEQAPERPLAAKVGGGIGDQGSRTNDQGNDGDDGPTSILKGDGFLQKSSRWDGLSTSP